VLDLVVEQKRKTAKSSRYTAMNMTIEAATWWALTTADRASEVRSSR